MHVRAHAREAFVCVYVCVCVCARARELVYVCMCVCVLGAGGGDGLVRLIIIGNNVPSIACRLYTTCLP